MFSERRVNPYQQRGVLDKERSIQIKDCPTSGTWTLIGNESSEDKIMSNKALYIPLIMTLLGAQAGLQTAIGQDSGSQHPSEEGSYTVTFDPTSTSMRSDIKSQDTNSMTPQATPQLTCQFDAASGTTDSAGRASIYCTNCIIQFPVCGTYQNDYPHRMTFDRDPSLRYLRITSWAPWFDFAAGPIWYSCHFYKCQ